MDEIQNTEAYRLISKVTNVIGDLRDEYGAFRAMGVLREETTNKIVPFGVTLYVSHDAGRPILQYVVFPTSITCGAELGFTNLYTIGQGRDCFPWDIFRTEEDAELMNNFKLEFGYFWEIAVRKLKAFHGL